MLVAKNFYFVTRVAGMACFGLLASMTLYDLSAPEGLEMLWLMLSVHYLGVPAYRYYPAMVFHTSFGWYSLSCLLPVGLAATMVKEQLSEDYFVAAGIADHCQKDLDRLIYSD